jgi:hypothetical protein
MGEQQRLLRELLKSFDGETLRPALVCHEGAPLHRVLIKKG